MSLILGILAQSAGAVGGGTSYESIATVTVGSGGSGTIDFTSIPSTYTHLQIRALFGTNGAGQAYAVNFNSDTANNYAYHYLQGNGASTSVGASINRAFTLLTDNSGAGTSTSPSVFVMDLLDYRSTSKNKTIRLLNGYDGNGSGDIRLDSGLWFATPAAITSISISGLSSATFSQYSSFALYGIKGV
jgi:hypothetical protein